MNCISCAFVSGNIKLVLCDAFIFVSSFILYNLSRVSTYHPQLVMNISFFFLFQKEDAASTIDFASLRSLADLGIDVSFIDRYGNLLLRFIPLNII